MTIQRMEHVGIVVDDLAAATAFFVELGLKLQGDGPVEGGRVDRVVGSRASGRRSRWWTEEGRCAVFVMIDHASGEAWADAGLRMDRFAAADLLREVTTERFGSVEHAVAAGLALRYDGGPCFRSEHYQVEIDHLGIARSPAYHYEPETNGCAEKFIQTLKEQVLWIERFATFEELRAAVRRFTLTHNREWLLERHGYRTPTEARAHLAALAQPAMA